MFIRQLCFGPLINQYNNIAINNTGCLAIASQYLYIYDLHKLYLLFYIDLPKQISDNLLTNQSKDYRILYLYWVDNFTTDKFLGDLLMWTTEGVYYLTFYCSSFVQLYLTEEYIHYLPYLYSNNIRNSCKYKLMEADFGYSKIVVSRGASTNLIITSHFKVISLLSTTPFFKVTDFTQFCKVQIILLSSFKVLVVHYEYLYVIDLSILKDSEPVRIFCDSQLKVVILTVEPAKTTYYKLSILDITHLLSAEIQYLFKVSYELPDIEKKYEAYENGMNHIRKICWKCGKLENGKFSDVSCECGGWFE